MNYTNRNTVTKGTCKKKNEKICELGWGEETIGLRSVRGIVDR